MVHQLSFEQSSHITLQRIDSSIKEVLSLPTQLKEAPPFSLEHPTQYFLESRKLRGVKKEVELPVKQEDATANEFADISAQDLEGFDDDMDTN